MPRGVYDRTQKPQSKITKMSTDEVAGLKQEVEEREEILKNVDGLGTELQDKSRMAEDVRRKKMIIQRDEDMAARGKDKDRIAREIRDLEEQVVSERPTTEEMNYPLGSRESQRAVEKNIAFHKKHGATMVKIQDLRRRLEPEDPMAGNLEHVRPDQFRRKISLKI